VYEELPVSFFVSHSRWEPGAKCGLPTYVVLSS
jgi:hypothetical protein